MKKGSIIHSESKPNLSYEKKRKNLELRQAEFKS